MRDEGSARREPTGYKVRRALARRQPRPSPRTIREKRTTCRLPLTGNAPYKGAVENANGRPRRDLPRDLDLDALGDAELQEIVLSHNLTPRKCLGFLTPPSRRCSRSSAGT